MVEDYTDHVTPVECADIPLESHKQIRVCPNTEHRSLWEEDPSHLSMIHKQK